MENREDLRTILPFLPVRLGSSSLYWPSQVFKALKSMSKGPEHSKVNSGELLFKAIFKIRSSLSPNSHSLADFAGHGYCIFFDNFMSRAESTNWFSNILPALAKLLLRLPSLLESHYVNSDSVVIEGETTSLRLLGHQEAGIVLLSQELIAALLACSLFCMFPTNTRRAKSLPTINFDRMFASLYYEKVEHKIRCIVHYFERIFLSMPTGSVSFERKVLPWNYSPYQLSYPKANFWSRSRVRLCRFQVHESLIGEKANTGLIEDDLSGGLQVDFANKYLGGGALGKGCVQEEIRFMINPELIAGRLFLPSMSDNEAIEIVGTERFSSYAGYGLTFRFSGKYEDLSEMDSLRRRKTRIIAIDALYDPRERQYKLKFLLRETNKAFCGFHDPSKNEVYLRMSRAQLDGDVICSSSKDVPCVDHFDDVGIVTGNWGCGAFGGDHEIKMVIQWLAASQALRPFISYYTCSEEALRDLDKVIEWIDSQEWTVGALWHMLVEYSSRRYRGQTKLGFLDWLVPSISEDTIMHDVSHTPFNSNLKLCQLFQN